MTSDIEARDAACVLVLQRILIAEEKLPKERE